MGPPTRSSRLRPGRGSSWRMYPSTLQRRRRAQRRRASRLARSRLRIWRAGADPDWISDAAFARVAAAAGLTQRLAAESLQSAVLAISGLNQLRVNACSITDTGGDSAGRIFVACESRCGRRTQQWKSTRRSQPLRCCTLEIHYLSGVQSQRL